MFSLLSKVLFVSLIHSVTAHAVTEKTDALTIYTEQFPPYNFEVNDRLVGINLELAKAACELADIDCQFELYPWNRSMKMVQKTPLSGIVSTARTSERETMFEWVGPFSSSTNCLFKLSSRKDIVVNDIASAQQYILGGSTDNAYKELRAVLGFEEGKNLILFNGKYGTLKPFAAGRVDLVMMSSFSISQQLEVAGLTLAEVTPVLEIDSHLLNGNYLALNKAVPKEVVSRLKDAMAQLFKEKAQAKIEAKYIGNVDLVGVSSSNDPLWNACAKRQIAEPAVIPINA
jgi:polar amino acid transport system substrate-binding protein